MLSDFHCREVVDADAECEREDRERKSGCGAQRANCIAEIAGQSRNQISLMNSRAGSHMICDIPD